MKLYSNHFILFVIFSSGFRYHSSIVRYFGLSGVHLLMKSTHCSELIGCSRLMDADL